MNYILERGVDVAELGVSGANLSALAIYRNDGFRPLSEIIGFEKNICESGSFE